MINIFSVMVVLSILLFIQDTIIEDSMLLRVCNVGGSIATGGMLLLLILMNGVA